MASAYRIKVNAQGTALKAIRDGRLVRQPCEVCGAAIVDAHHDDYSKPLDVRWLCRAHHAAHHAKINRNSYLKGAQMFTVADMLDKFVPDHFPKLARRTQLDGMRHVEILKEQFGHIEADKLTARQIGQWMNGGPTRGKIQRGKIVSVLATAYKYAVGEYFLVDSNPTRDLRMPKGGKRTRYVTDAEFQAVRSICSARLQAAMDLAYITGQRQGDILGLRWDMVDVVKRVISLRQSKTGKEFGIYVTPALEEILVRCKRMSPALPREYILRTKSGAKYSSAGFRAMWRRAIVRAVELGLVKTPFTFHDLRAKCASDHPEINKAADLLGHQNPMMTKTVYDRSVRIVQPLR